MNEGRWYPTSTLLPNGQVVITSGLRRDGSGTINPDVNVFTPNPSPTGTGTITTVNQKVFNLYPHQFVVRDGKMLVAGPFTGDVGLLNPSGWTWSSVPPLRANHYYGSAVLLPDGPSGSSKVMVISGDQQASTEVIDEENLGAGWSNRAPLPVHRRNANSVLTPDGALITIGGNGTDNFDAPRFEALRYNPAANTWTELAPQAEPRGYHSTALLLPDGRIVSAGDDGPAGGGGQSDEIEIFSPPYLFAGARPTISSAPDQIGFGAQFTVGSPNTDIASAVLVAPGATTHANDMHQRLVPLVMSPVTGGYALTGPPSANVAPPGYYMLFLVNGQGVPSVAKFVRLAAGAPPPPDTTPPTVAVSAPAPGATVSGTATPVSATASDDVGVVGVQFTLDGANLGAEDTSAPYSVSWNTTTASNGAHTLRAIARDASNSTTSAPVERHRLQHRPAVGHRPGGRLRLRGDDRRDRHRLLARRQPRHDRRRRRPHRRRKDRPRDRLRRGQRLRLGGRRQQPRSHHRDDHRGLGAAGHRQLLAHHDPEGEAGRPGLLALRQLLQLPAPGRDRHRRRHRPPCRDRPGAHRRHLDPPGGHLRQRPAAPVQERRPGGPERGHRRHPGLGQPAADRRQRHLGRVHRRAHRRGADLQPRPVGRRDHHRHDHARRRGRTPAARRHAPHGERQLPGRWRERPGHHPGQRHRRRQRGRGRGPVHPRRGQPGRRGHQRPLLGELEHDDDGQRPPCPSRDRP